MIDAEMPEPRIDPLPVEAAAQAAGECGVPTFMAKLSIFQVLLRHPRLAKAVNDLLMVMLAGKGLDARLRELAIMRVGWLTGSAYEWTQHWKIAQDFGVSSGDLLALRDWKSAGVFSDADRAVLQATDEIVTDGAITGATWKLCQERLPDEIALIELVTAIGAWRMVASILTSLNVPLEPGVEPWPPDGTVPGS